MYEKFRDKNYKGKILLMTHTDLDGYGPEVILRILSGEPYFMERFTDYDVVHVSTGYMDTAIRETCLDTETWENYGCVFITDISCSKTTAEEIMSSGCADRSVLLDHHKTASCLNEFPFALISAEDNASDDEWSLPKRNNEVRHACGTSLFMGFLHEIMPALKKSIIYGTRLYRLITFVSHVAAWDTWDWKNIYDGAGAPENLNKLFRFFGSSLFVEDMERTIYMSMFKNEQDIMDDVLLSTLDRELLAIYEGKAREYLKRVEDTWENSHLEFEIYGRTRLFKMVLLTCNEYISEVFEFMKKRDSEQKYDIYAIDCGGTISMRSVKDDVDVSEVAARYGGGGHVHAAGFSYGKFKMQLLNTLLQ